MSLAPGSATHQLRLQAFDAAGNRSAPQTTTISLGLLQENSHRFRYTGSWKKSSLHGASGGKVTWADKAGRRVRTSVTARSVALVSTLGPDRGKAEVWVDGKRVARLDLYARKRTPSRIVWESALPAGAHTVEVRVPGTKSRHSSGKRVDLDALLTLR